MKINSTHAALIMSFLSTFTTAAPTPEPQSVQQIAAGCDSDGYHCDKKREAETEPICDPAGDAYTGFHCENPPNPDDVPATGVEAREADAEAQSVYQIIAGCDSETGFHCDKKRKIVTEPICDPAGDGLTGFHCENPPNPDDVPDTGLGAREADAEAQFIYQIIEGCDDPDTDTNCDKKREVIDTEPVCDPAGDGLTGFHCENPPNPEDTGDDTLEKRLNICQTTGKCPEGGI